MMQLAMKLERHIPLSGVRNIERYIDDAHPDQSSSLS